jgi:Tfp pilus assembly protein PilO
MQIDRPIAIALTLFIILLLVFFLVVPEYNTFGKLQTELGEKTAEFNAEYDYYAAIAKTHNDLQGRQDEIKKIDNALPNQPQDSILGKLIYSLQQTAKDNGLLVKNLFLSKSSSGNAGPNVGDSVKDIVFSMDLSGNYASLENFIVSLEKSSRIFEITNVSFSFAPGSLLESFSLQIKTHSY